MKPNPPLESLILTLRQQKVILDADLAELYGVPTKRLNEQVKRNAERFPADFMFQLTPQEWRNLRSQSVTTSSEQSGNDMDAPNRSQIATGSQRHRDPRLRPYAFTEHGALMAANVLNSREAVKMSVYVVRAFIKQRELLLAQADVLKRLAQMDATLLKHDEALRHIWQELQPLLTPPPPPPKRQIGFLQSPALGGRAGLGGHGWKHRSDVGGFSSFWLTDAWVSRQSRSMKIAAIVKTEDDPKKVVVLRTEPGLTAEVFDEFKPYAAKHLDDKLQFGFRLGFLTVNRIHNIVTCISGIEQCLTYAENSLANRKGEAESAREKAFRELGNQLSLPVEDAPAPRVPEVAGKPAN